MWRDTPALRGGSFELLLDNWIKKGEGDALCSPWEVGASEQEAAVVPVLSSACGCREQLVLASSNFQSWGYKLRRVKWQSCLTRS